MGSATSLVSAEDCRLLSLIISHVMRPPLLTAVLLNPVSHVHAFSLHSALLLHQTVHLQCVLQRLTFAAAAWQADYFRETGLPCYAKLLMWAKAEGCQTASRLHPCLQHGFSTAAFITYACWLQYKPTTQVCSSWTVYTQPVCNATL